MREYFDIDGHPTTLFKLVRTEPDWAISRLKKLEAERDEADKRIAELEEQAAINKDYIEQYQRQVKELESHISQRECYQRGYKAGRKEIQDD